MADKMTPADASNVLEAVRVLEDLERKGELTPTEAKALARFRAKNGGPSQEDLAREENIKTRAAYRGMASGATMNAKDELWGAINALTGGSYAAGRDDVRQRDKAAQMLAPQEYGMGEIAGIGAISALPIGGASATATRLGVPMLGRVIAGAAEGAGLTALPQFMKGEGGFTNRVGEIDPFWTGVGGAIGGAVPAAGQIASGVTRTLERLSEAAPGYGSKATAVMSRAFDKAQRGGEDIQAYLRGLGPEGMIADIPGAPRATAQGIATMGGGGATVLNREINARAAGAGDRIDQAIDAVAGGPNRAFQERRANAEARSTQFGPMYDAAKQHPDPIDVRPITSWLVMQRENSVGNVRSEIDKLLVNLGTKDGSVSAERLHNIRTDLSDTISEATRGGRGGQVEALLPVLKGIDQKLDQIPGYAPAREGWANTRELDRMMEEGRTALTGGATTVELPAEFAARFNKMSDAKKEAMRAGVREYIAALMGTSRNAPASAWGQLADKGFSEQKLRTLFGDNEANQILTRLRAEKSFSETRSDVLKGSQTDFRNAARNDLGDVAEPETGTRPTPIQRVKRALIDDPINAAIDSILYGNRRSKANEEIGRILTLQGAERDRAVQALLGVAMREGVDSRKQKMARTLADALAGGYGMSFTAGQQQDRR